MARNPQLNFDGTPLAQLQAYSTQLDAAIQVRLIGSLNTKSLDAAQEYTVKGRHLVRATLEELMEMKAQVDNAIQKRALEPDGVGIALGQFSDPQAGTTAPLPPWGGYPA